VSHVTNLLEPLLPDVAYLALLLRVVVGASLMVHGYPKLGGEGKKASMGFMKSQGVPGSTAFLAGILEFFGGSFLIIGLIVPVVAFFFILQFGSIVVLKGRKMKMKYIVPGKPNFEIDVTYLLLSLVLLVLGAGAFSLDGLVGL
jgi:putative oxidoreductase